MITESTTSKTSIPVSSHADPHDEVNSESEEENTPIISGKSNKKMLGTATKGRTLLPGKYMETCTLILFSL